MRDSAAGRYALSGNEVRLKLPVILHGHVLERYIYVRGPTDSLIYMLFKITTHIKVRFTIAIGRSAHAGRAGEHAVFHREIELEGRTYSVLSLVVEDTGTPRIILIGKRLGTRNDDLAVIAHLHSGINVWIAVDANLAATSVRTGVRDVEVQFHLLYRSLLLDDADGVAR